LKFSRILGFAIILGAFTLPAKSQEHAHLIFIVHPNNPIKDLTEQEISDFYFKKARFWKDGSKIRFFDQSPNSAAHRTFMQRILKKTAREIDLFWISEKNYNGQGAPVAAPSDEMVISSVASLPGSIGYISSTDEDLSGVKKVFVKGLE
jgi:ABC-type phosphate transport system substrate-binding protein